MSDTVIAIVDYQAGNLRSVQKALEESRVDTIITNDTMDIEKAHALIFPGQGACDAAMNQLNGSGLGEAIKAFIASGKPFLGICLGLQLLLEESEEGSEPCLGLIPGRVRRLPAVSKIPHIGWNQVNIQLDHPVLKGIPNGSYFYFVHSYYADVVDKSIVVGTSSYGFEFSSVVARDNVIAVQFHPEKSGRLGLKFYRNFVELVDKTRKGSAWK